MDPEGRQAARLLEALWAIRQQLWELEVRLGSAPEVTSARSTSSFRRYSDRTPPERRTPWIEFGLWAELGEGRDIVAWLGVRWDEKGWGVRCYAKLEHEVDRETYLLRIPEEGGGDEVERTIEGFVASLESVCGRLIRSVEGIALRRV